MPIGAPVDLVVRELDQRVGRSATPGVLDGELVVLRDGGVSDLQRVAECWRCSARSRRQRSRCRSRAERAQLLRALTPAP